MHGTPRAMYTATGPQYDFQEFRQFALQWEFDCVTIKGFGEKTVDCAKKAARGSP